MKKVCLILCLIFASTILCGCTKQVVFLNMNIERTKKEFDNFIKTTGYSYKVKDDENNIYNIYTKLSSTQYGNSGYVSGHTVNCGVACKFKALTPNNTLMDCKTYPPDNIDESLNLLLKEAKKDNIKYVSYKKWKKEYGNNEL